MNFPDPDIMSKFREDVKKKSRSTALCNRRRAAGFVMFQAQAWVKPETQARLKLRFAVMLAEEIKLQNAQG
jgi:hypothetical protein